MAVDHRGYRVEAMFTAAAIAARVGELAGEISAHFAGTERLIVVSLLRGAFVFTADLVRGLALPVEVDFLQVSSYGDAMQSSGEVKIIHDINTEVAGQDVLLVEDIIDTGHTLAMALGLMKARGPRRLEVCTLLDKPSRRQVEAAARWIGFEIPDEFVVGYGIDYAQRNRQLPFIGKVVQGG